MVALYDPILAGIVRILGPHRQVVGTGFLVSLSYNSGLIATSTRVVERATSLPVNRSFCEKVQVLFHLDDSNTPWEAFMMSWSSSIREDISVLKVEGTLPKRIRALPLSLATSSEGRKVSLFGYPPDNRNFAGKWSCGDISRLGPKHTQTELPFLQLDSQLITDEYSGSPVWDDERRKVIGVVTQVMNQDRQGGRQSAYAAPVELLKLVYNDIQPAKPSLYHGLAPFSKHDAASFFGYEDVVTKMVNKLHKQRHFLAVIGPVGSGKTSVVQAGLLKRLDQGQVEGSEDWGLFIASLSDNPFQQLEAEGMEGASINLSSSIHTLCQKHHCQRLVFVLDHFENVLLQCPHDTQKQFVEQLLDVMAEDTTTVILVLKNEFYSLLSTHETLMEWVEECLVNVFAPSTKEEFLAITKKRANVPGAIQGSELFMEHLVEKLFEQKQTNSRSILALYALSQAQIESHQQKAQESGETLDTDMLLDLTEVSLNDWAEKIFSTLDEQQQLFAQRLFTQTILLGDEVEGRPDTTRSIDIATICQYESDSEAAYKTVYDLADRGLFVTSRNSYTGHEQVKIAQDELIREWQRLREWIRESHEFSSWQKTFRSRMDVWFLSSPDGTQSDNNENVLQGIALTEAELWYAKRPIDFDERARRFLQASQQWIQQQELLSSEKTIIEQGKNRQLDRFLLARDFAAQAMTYYTQHPSQIDRGIKAAVAALAHAHCPEADQALRRGLLLLSRQIDCIPFPQAPVLAFSHDWQYIAFADENYNVEVVELATKRQRFRLTHTVPIDLMTFDYMNEHLVVVDKDRMVSVWKIFNGTRCFSYHEASSPTMLKFSLDGRYLAVVNWDGASTEMKIWKVDSWDHHSVLHEKEYVNTIDFNHNNTLLAIGGKDGTITVRTTTGKEDLFAEQLHSPISHVIFSPGGQYLAVGNERKITVLNMDTFEPLVNEQQNAQVHSLVFSPQGNYLAAGMSDGTVWVWEIPTGRQFAQLTHTGSTHDVAFSFDNAYLATASDEKIVHIWDTNTYQEITQLFHEQYIQKVTFSMNRRHFFTFSDDHIARVWEIIKSRQCVAFASPASPTIVTCVIEDDILYLTAVCTDATLRQWQINSNTGQLITEQSIFSITEQRQASLISSSSDGQYLAIATTTGDIRIWNMVQTKELISFSCKGPLIRIAFCHDPDYLAVMSSDGTTYLWKWEKKDLLETIDLNITHSVHDIVLSPDELYLSTIGNTDTAHVWESSTFGASPLFALSETIQEVYFSPDGRVLATRCKGYEAFLWRMPDGFPLFPFTHQHKISAITFSPDSQYIATASEDQTVKIWETATGHLVSELVHKAGVHTVAFSPDGMYLATGDGNGVVSAWLWRIEDLIHEALWKGKDNE